MSSYICVFPVRETVKVYDSLFVENTDASSDNFAIKFCYKEGSLMIFLESV